LTIAANKDFQDLPYYTAWHKKLAFGHGEKKMSLCGLLLSETSSNADKVLQKFSFKIEQ